MALAQRGAGAPLSTSSSASSSASLNGGGQGVVTGTAGAAASSICAFLICQVGMRCDEVAHNVGLPPLVVEQSIRNATASEALCGQLREWLQEASSVMSRVPPSLVAALYEDAADEHNARMRDLNTSEAVEAGTLFSVLDPASQSHFSSLEATVGQSFISILNDPETTDDADWGSWLSGRIYEALDHGLWTSGGAQEARVASAARSGGGVSSIVRDTAADLLLQYPLRMDLSEYVRLVSGAYAANRKEGRYAFGTADTALTSGGVGGGGGLPWPYSVPREFFSKTYDVRKEMTALPVAAQLSSSLPLSSPPTTPLQSGDAARVVTSTTFTKDCEVIEARAKELRGWEASVEQCLLRHVQSRSEDFFTTTQSFGELSSEAQCALDDLRHYRDGSIAHGRELVRHYLHIGVLYRRRGNYRVLNTVVGRLQTLRRHLVDVENWAALPERDMLELPVVTERLVEFERFLEVRSSDGSGGATGPHQPDSWAAISSLKCMAGVPGRVRVARRLVEDLVRTEIIAALSGDLHEAGADTWTRITRACRGAALLNILESTLRTYKTVVVTTMWSAAQELITGFLMSSGKLDDAKANELLSLPTSTYPLAAEKKALMLFCGSCEFPAYMLLFSDVLSLLVSALTRLAQGWGFFLVEGLLRALELYDDVAEFVRAVSFDLFATVCGEAEALLTTLLEVRTYSSTMANAREVEELVWTAYSVSPQLTEPLARLEVVYKEGLTGLVDHVRCGRVIHSAARQYARAFFGSQHKGHMEKVRMLLDKETWVPMESVNPAFQSHLESLCAADDAAVARFEATSLESGQWPLISQHQHLGGVAQPGRSERAGGDGESDDVLLSGASKKLYLDPGDEEAEGRVVCISLLILLELLQDYNGFLACFPSLAFSVVSKMYELLDFYDKYCARLVLGGTAVGKGTLTTITVQHLCAASQCIALIAELVPGLQQRLRRVLHTHRDGEQNEGENKKQARLLPFINDELARVEVSCQAHHSDFLRKMAVLVEVKVDGLGAMEVNGQWPANGNAWVMTMLREVARLLRTLRVVLPPADVRGAVAPLLGSFALKIRRVTRAIPATATDARASATSDILLFKANVEKFGYDVLKCAAVESVRAAMRDTNMEPSDDGSNTDQAVLDWFFAPRPSPAA